jgi:anti-sigma regulatory factor (Ser/Thr protein kinase)
LWGAEFSGSAGLVNTTSRVEPERAALDEKKRIFRTTIEPDYGRLSDIRSRVARLAERAGFSEDRSYDLQLTVSEACANAIEHTSARIEVVSWLLADRVIVEVLNHTDFTRKPGSAGPRANRGLGLPLMIALSDEIHVSRLVDGRLPTKLQVAVTFFRQPQSVSSEEDEGSPRSLKVKEQSERLKALAAFEELARLESEGAACEAKLAAVLNTVSDAVTIAEGKPAKVRANKQSEKLLGRPLADIDDLPLKEHPKAWRIYHRDGFIEATETELPLARVLQTGGTVKGEEWLLRKPSGDDVLVTCSAEAFCSRDGEILGGVAAWRKQGTESG